MGNIFILKTHQFAGSLQSIEPIMIIAPFGINTEFETTEKVKAITSADGLQTNFFRKTNLEVRQNNTIHAKLAIGKHGALFGSWNLSGSKNHELVMACDTAHPIYKGLIEFFNEAWADSKPIDMGGAP